MGDSSTKATVIKVVILIVVMVAVAVVAVLVTLASVAEPQLYGPTKAVVVLNVIPAGSSVTGVLELSQNGPASPVLITGTINGLSPNSKHGFHVHSLGDIRQGCGSTGSHFNPANVTHGGPTDLVRHVGDLGNVDANGSGQAQVHISDHVISLSGPNCIIGRAFVVHALVDDLGKGGFADSLTTGHAGDRVGCGIVGVL